MSTVPRLSVWQPACQNRKWTAVYSIFIYHDPKIDTRLVIVDQITDGRLGLGFLVNYERAANKDGSPVDGNSLAEVLDRREHILAYCSAREPLLFPIKLQSRILSLCQPNFKHLHQSILGSTILCHVAPRNRCFGFGTLPQENQFVI